MDALDVRIDPLGVHWFRQSTPMFDPLTPLVRAITAADFAHGLTPPMGCDERPVVAFPNTDFTVHLFRKPLGDWIGVDAAVAWSSDAIGAGWAALSDGQGLVGRVAMSIAIMPLKEPSG
jgi:Acyl-CoA thioesterase C-terminal domain